LTPYGITLQIRFNEMLDLPNIWNMDQLDVAIKFEKKKKEKKKYTQLHWKP
jgi:hypothetical protein